MWNWYQWDLEETFNTWHDEIRARLNYPLQSYNQATGLLDETAPLTVNYTEVYLIDGKYIGRVEDSESEGLTPTDIRPPKPEGFED